MKAIKVRYIGPTNTKPSRVVAHDADGHKATVSYNTYDNFQQAADAAVQALLTKMEWSGKMVSGGYGEDLFYVFTEEPYTGWEKHPDSRAEAKGYQVWIDRGLWTVYNITKLDQGPPTSESGYKSLEALLKLKNIIP